MSLPKPEYKPLAVLVVDDIFNVRAMLKNMLKQLGFQTILEARDGYQALERLKQNVVDLILCDWNMPKMKGVDVLRFVRRDHELQHLPFIMVTGELSEEIVAEAAETEVDDYLVKPFTLEQLGHKIENLIKTRKEVSGIDDHLKKGRAYITTNQLDRASAEFKAALAINPKSPRTLLEIGRLYEEQGNDVQAKGYYQRAIEIQPKFLKAYDHLAQLAGSLGDVEGQLKYLKRAMKISPRNLERRLMLGEALVQNGDLEEAKGIYTKVLEEASQQYSEIAQRVGDALMAIGAFEQAEEAFGRAIDANPDNLHLYNELGIAYRKQGKFKEAVANYLRAVKLSPSDENLLYNLGRAYYDMGEYQRGAKALEQAVKISPNFEEAVKLMKACQAKQG